MYGGDGAAGGGGGGANLCLLTKYIKKVNVYASTERMRDEQTKSRSSESAHIILDHFISFHWIYQTKWYQESISKNIFFFFLQF